MIDDLYGKYGERWKGMWRDVIRVNGVGEEKGNEVKSEEGRVKN